MEIKVNREVFSEAFAKCVGAISTRSPREILQNVHLEVIDGAGVLSATDTETSVIVAAPVECVKPGSVLLHPSRMTPILRESNSDEIGIRTDGNNMLVSAGDAEWSLPSLDVNEFPRPQLIEGEVAQVSADELRQAIKKTVFACDADSSRFALGGVNIESSGNGLVAVGTDGRRMSRVLFGQGCKFERALVPQKAALLIQKADMSGTVAITSNPSCFQVASEGITIITRQVEGRYPNWQQVIPNIESRDEAKVSAGRLAQAIRQAAIVADAETRGIDFSFSIGRVSLSTKTQDKGSAVIEAEVEYLGKDCKVKLDYSYVLDFLKTQDASDTLSIFLDGSTSSVLFMDSQDAAYVVMPMALTN